MKLKKCSTFTHRIGDLFLIPNSENSVTGITLYCKANMMYETIDNITTPITTFINLN